jgi:hypothetical protein
MKNLFLMFAFVLTTVVGAYSQEVKYVIFTSDKKAKQTGEGIYKYTSEIKSDTHVSPPIRFRFVSKSRGISGMADHRSYNLENLAKKRKVTEKDKLDIKEDKIEFLESVNPIDMDILFPKMTKDEFIKTWNSLWNKTVYFIDRSDIKNNKIILYPVKVAGINLY